MAQPLPTHWYPVMQGAGAGVAHWPVPLHKLAGPVWFVPEHVIVTLQGVLVGA